LYESHGTWHQPPGVWGRGDKRAVEEWGEGSEKPKKGNVCQQKQAAREKRGSQDAKPAWKGSKKGKRPK